MSIARRLHDRALELAASALDFGLAPADAAELADHLATCSACARTAGALRGDAALLRNAPATLIPPRRVDDAVAAAIADRSPRTSPQRLLLLVAAAALLLVGLLGVAAAGSFILRTWTTVPTVVLPSPSATAVVVDPTPSPPPAWQLAAIPPMFAGGLSTPVAVAAGPTELAAVGRRTFQDLEGPSGGTGGAWHSTDGLAWEPATSIAELAVGDMIPTSGPEAGLVDVAWGPPGFVAVGIALENGAIGGAWHSGDGLTWTRSELPDSTLARPTAVTWDGSSFIAVGAVEEPGSPRGAAWLSADGRSWRRAPDGDAFDIGGYVDTGEYHAWFGPADVTTAADGTLYAVGRTCEIKAGDDTGTCSPYVIRSVGGETWSSVPVPDGAGFFGRAGFGRSHEHARRRGLGRGGRGRRRRGRSGMAPDRATRRSAALPGRRVRRGVPGPVDGREQDRPVDVARRRDMDGRTRGSPAVEHDVAPRRRPHRRRRPGRDRRMGRHG